MKRLGLRAVAGALVWGLAAWSCADWDNPTALSDEDLSAAFDVHATRVETFEAVEIHVELMWGDGSPIGVEGAELEIEHAVSGALQSVPMEPGEHGYAASVTFFQPGEHHLHVHGMPEHHSLMAELAEHEVEVHRRHQVIGPYWVELESSPAPLLEGTEGHIHVLVFELSGDGTPGDAVSGLSPSMELEVHDPVGATQPLSVAEEGPGEYETSYSFTGAGVYELHVEIEVDGVHQGGEFHIPVLSETGDDVEDDHGGDGHDHSH